MLTSWLAKLVTNHDTVTFHFNISFKKEIYVDFEFTFFSKLMVIWVANRPQNTIRYSSSK